MSKSFLESLTSCTEGAGEATVAYKITESNILDKGLERFFCLCMVLCDCLSVGLNLPSSCNNAKLSESRIRPMREHVLFTKKEIEVLTGGRRRKGRNEERIFLGGPWVVRLI